MKKIFIFICLFSILKVNGLNAKCDREIFSDIPSNKVTMTGWAGEFLNRQITGLTGHPEQSGFPFNRDGWINGLDYKDREFDGGLSWFPYEQVAYYLDGSLRCGFMTHNERLINNVKRNIYYLLSTRDSNGQFRIKDVEEDWWPLVVFIRMMVEEYKDTKDPNILDALVKHYKATYSGNKGTDFVFTGFSSRSLLHIENLCSIYDFTKDIWFLNTAERLYNTFEEKNKVLSPLTVKGMLAGKSPSGHAVTYHEFLKLPIVLYYYTNKQIYRDAFERGFEMLHKEDELADGLSSGVENLQGNASNMAHELCNSIDFNWTCGWALLATGEAKYADKMEKNIYNAGFSSITPDFRAHQYYGAPNMPISSSMSSSFNDKTNWGLSAKKRLCFRPGHDTECCTGNMHRLFPTFINRSSMISDKRVCINFYLPGEISVKVDGKPFTFKQETNYPFEFSSKITIKESSDKSLNLGLRIPGWAKSYRILYNGKLLIDEKCDAAKYYNIKRHFRKDDVVEISFYTEPEFCKTSEGVAVNYGPLVYSYQIEAAKNIITKDDAGKCSKEFPAYELLPKDPSNCFYGLLVNEKIQVEHIKRSGYPWDFNNSPILLKVKAKKIKNWTLREWTYLTDFPKSLETENKIETLTLYPLGSTFLRISDFPIIN